MARHELSDDEWERIEVLLPSSGGGRPWRDHRSVINGILWILMTGAPWRDLPTGYGPFTTVHGRFTRWSRDGTWVRLQRALLRQLDERGKLDRNLWFIDGSSVRASRAAATGGKRGAPASQGTTPSVAREAALAARSIGSAIGTARRWPSTSARVSATKASGSSGRWTACGFQTEGDRRSGARGCVRQVGRSLPCPSPCPCPCPRIEVGSRNRTRLQRFLLDSATLPENRARARAGARAREGLSDTCRTDPSRAGRHSTCSPIEDGTSLSGVSDGSRRRVGWRHASSSWPRPSWACSGWPSSDGCSGFLLRRPGRRFG